jgi:tetratricopeptide (TPR) repeat protein
MPSRPPLSAEAVETARPTLQISYDADQDYLEATLPGAVIDGPLEEEVDEILEGLHLVRRAGGPVVGFGVQDAFAWDPEANAGDAAVWGERLRFDVPTLALTDAPIGLVVLAAQRTLEGSTSDVLWFDLAVAQGEDPAAAEHWWRACLATGQLRAHFGLGYTLLALDRPGEAYGHLAAYTGLAPHNSWAWHWRGQAAEALGEPGEAIACFRRAVEAEAAGSWETDADAHLERLDGPADP